MIKYLKFNPYNYGKVNEVISRFQTNHIQQQIEMGKATKHGGMMAESLYYEIYQQSFKAHSHGESYKTEISSSNPKWKTTKPAAAISDN